MSKGATDQCISLLPRAGFFDVKKSRLKKLFIKSVALTLIFTTGSSQLLFAGDPRQMLEDAKRSFLTYQSTRRPGGSEPGDYDFQRRQQDEIDRQEALQNLDKLNFTLTTKGDDLLRYVDGKLFQIVRLDGSVLKNLQTDANGNILNTDFKFPDNSVQIYRDGKVIGYEMPDGTQVLYDGPRVQKTVSKAGVETVYSYTNDADGKIIQTILDSPTYHSIYDKDGKLKEVLEKGTGTKTFYAAGLIDKILKSDGSQFIFNRQISANGEALVNFGKYIDPAGNQFDFNGDTISSVTLPDGSALENIVWKDDGTIDSATKIKDGNKYFYVKNILDKIVFFDTSTLESLTWNADKSLHQALLTDAGRVKSLYLDGSVAQIQALDGSVIRNIVWDSNKRIKDGVLTDSTGIEFYYRDGVVYPLTKPPSSTQKAAVFIMTKRWR
ncbi:MAG: hypothetical protein HYZ52_06420 [Candidatus Omnitrophica bacterium]|nr:hypothetical protein [Candidatus Omnitrophota bacterium]